MAPHPGQLFASEIEREIRERDVLVLLATRHSVGDTRTGATGSDDVRRELLLAVQQRKLIVPLAADDVLPKKRCADGFGFMLVLNQYVDIRRLSEAALRQICDAIRGENTVREDYTQSILDEVERLLKAGRHRRARDLLGGDGAIAGDDDRHRFLAVVARLMSSPLHKHPKALVDACVERLFEITDGQLADSARYALALLSRFYYQVHSLKDPTGGFTRLRDSATAGSPSGATFNLLRPLVPEEVGFSFEREWKYG